MAANYWVRPGEPRDVSDDGAMYDGTTDASAAIAACITKVQAAGGGVVQVSDHTLIASGLTVPDGVDLRCVGPGRLRYTGTGTAITVNGGFYGDHRIRVYRPSAGWYSGSPELTSIGLCVKNARFTTIAVPELGNFATGIQMLGDADGCVVNTLNLGYVYQNRRGLAFSAINGGWSNQNVFVGGQIRLNSGPTPGLAGTTAVHIPADCGNGNTFVGINLEGEIPEYTIDCQDAYNLFIGCRLEGSRGVRINDPLGSSMIVGGYGIGAYPDYTIDITTLGAGKNKILGPVGAAAAIPDPSGGTVIDVQARAALASLLAHLRLDRQVEP